MNITIIGTGYVGLTTAVVLSYLNHNVSAVDIDEHKLSQLHEGRSPIHEPGIQTLLDEVCHTIRFTPSVAEVVPDAELIMIAVGTPPKKNGEADTRHVEEAAREVAEVCHPERHYTLVIKSTVPIGTNRRVAHVVNKVFEERGIQGNISIASNPEFLQEGLALQGAFYPDRIVVGANNDDAFEVLRRLYQPILEQTFDPPTFLPRPAAYHLPPMMTTDPNSAEMIKYAANTFLALKISFINEIAGLCEDVGADVTEVARGIGLDSRIGHRFLRAGLGWGGSCYPKDTAALLGVAAQAGYEMPITAAARTVNFEQRKRIVEKLRKVLNTYKGKTIGILGLAFKPNTDDIREAPALDIIHQLVAEGANVRAHDPIAIPNAQQVLSDITVEYIEDVYMVSHNADALILVTEWEPYHRLELRKLAKHMKTPILVDGRNVFSPKDAMTAGFHYIGVGR
ncbi:MAG: UDP-glucose/GDP-mannose dehydrogenase family protein [Candidatus Poribacteria bacterium]|nr:UDP-glucose/GDP-mannose dehydrogenase family protein [Candidatus Poribacteria bacterium]